MKSFMYIFVFIESGLLFVIIQYKLLYMEIKTMSVLLLQ